MTRESNWSSVSKELGTRTPRQCKDRWLTYLSPYVSNEEWTDEEDKLLISKLKTHGTKWTMLAYYFPRRTPTNIKNRAGVLKRRDAKIKKNKDKVQKKIKKQEKIEIIPKKEDDLFTFLESVDADIRDLCDDYFMTAKF
ncbi:Myb-like DNA-binding domain containing protein [Trichomonas vaginalis G3]|uniref:Myb-like DNA-binding domain containing protein n=1 Tax=Trichomonas vaginalis (strain ATCC PRA-98 / G3) TaxID=412133 RepID=A2GKP4_TRIV3|nr:Myb-like DNA-binding domain containing protein [Trichomonas vaginalis G3]|eukprot:XP_001295203.1 Myb-like DNA-binding domain containing protein [Trichomonas vaginalis G3]